MAGGTKDNYKSGIPQMWPDGANLDWRLTIADFISFWQVQWVNLKWKKLTMTADITCRQSRASFWIIHQFPPFFILSLNFFFSVICVGPRIFRCGYFDTGPKKLFFYKLFTCGLFSPAFYKIRKFSDFNCVFTRENVCAWWRPRALCVPLIESENGGPPPKSAPPRFFVLAKTSYAGPR